MRVLPLALVLAGCAPKHGADPFEPASVLGDWATEEGGVATFAIVGDKPCLAGVVDADGEHFEVQACSFGPDGFTWTYHVPSTGYTVSERVYGVEAHRLCTTWRNDDRSGEGCYMR